MHIRVYNTSGEHIDVGQRQEVIGQGRRTAHSVGNRANYSGDKEDMLACVGITSSSR